MKTIHILGQNLSIEMGVMLLSVSLIVVALLLGVKPVRASEGEFPAQPELMWNN